MIDGNLQSKGLFHQKSSFIKGCQSSKVVFHLRLFICFQFKGVFYKRLPSIKDHHPLKAVCNQISFSIKGLSQYNFFEYERFLLTKVSYHMWSSSITIQSKVIFHQRCLPSKKADMKIVPFRSSGKIYRKMCEENEHFG